MFSTTITSEALVAVGIFLGGLLASWIVATFALAFEERVSATVRPSVKPWRRAHRQALFWLLVTIATALSLRSVSSIDPYATEVERAGALAGTAFGALAVIHASNEALSWYVRGRLRITPILSRTALPIVQRFIAIAIVTVAFVFLLDTFGQPVTPLLAVLSVGGFGIAFAFRDTLANFFASTTLAADGALRIGDSVEVESYGQWGTVMGTVVGIGWRSTRILTRAHNIVSVPNAKLAESLVTNYSIPTRDMGIDIRCAVPLDSNLAEVERITIEIAETTQAAHPGALHSAHPSFVFEKYGDSSIFFNVLLRARGNDESYRLRSDFLKALSPQLAEHGIRISLPAQEIYLRQAPELQQAEANER